MTINYSKQVLVKRGNTAVSSTYTGPLGEITLDTDLHQLRLHDGETAGGWLVPSGQQFYALQANIAALANIDIVELANIATLFSNAAAQQETIQFLVDNSIEYVASNTAPTGNQTLWFDTNDGRLYAKYGNLWVDASPTVLPTPSYIFGTLENTAGNIIPDATNTYSLGSPEAQWKDLWVSNATIYLNSVPLGVDVTGNLTYNGNPLVSFVDGNLNVGGTVVSGGGAANTGSITFNDANIIGSNGTLVIQSNIARPDLTWAFSTGDEGDFSVAALTAPMGDDKDIGQIIFSGSDGGGALVYVGNIGSPFDNAFNLYGLGNANVKISTGIGNYQWTFDTTGNLILPQNNTIKSDNQIVLQAGDEHLTFGSDATLNFDFNGQIGFENQFRIKSLLLDKNWIFGAYGSTLIPGELTGADYLALGSTNYSDLRWYNSEPFVAPNVHYASNIRASTDGVIVATRGSDGSSQEYNNYWQFGFDGSLSMPGKEDGTPAVDFFGAAPGNHLVQLDSDWTVNILARNNGANQGHLNLVAGQNTRININGNGQNIELVTPGNTWAFSAAGLTFPDSTVQTTAWTGNINTTAGYINFTASPASGTSGITFADGTTLNSAARLARYDVDGGFYISENLDVDFDGHFGGNVTIAGNLDIIGNVNFTGNINQVTGNQGEFTGDPLTGVGALYAGKSGYTPVPSTIFQTTAYVNGYIQNNFQNLHPGNQASTEWVATADNGTDLTNYLDMGIAGGGWDGTQDNSVGTAASANDAYVYTVGNVDAGTGGNMIIGTIQPGKNLKVLVGGPGTGNVVATFSETGATFRDTIVGNISGSATFVTGLTSANVTTALGYTPATAADVTAANAAIVTANSAVVSYVNTLNSAMAANVVAANAAIVTANTAMKGYVDAQIASVPVGGGSTYSNANVVAYYTSANNFSVGSGTSQHILSNSTSVMIGNLTTILNGTNTQTATVLANNIGWFANGTQTGLRTGGASYLTMGSGTVSLVAGSMTAGGSGTLVNVWNAGSGFFNVFQTLTFQPGANIAVNSVGSVIGITANLAHTGSNFVTSSNVLVAGNVTVNGINGVRMPNRPAFRVYGTSSGQIVAPTTISSTHGATVDFNQGSYYNNTTGVFTAPVAGLYHAYATLRVGSNNGLNQATIVKNDSTSGANVVAFWETDTNTGTAVHFSMTGYASMVAGDTLRLKVLTGNVNLDTNDSWGVTYLG